MLKISNLALRRGPKFFWIGSISSVSRPEGGLTGANGSGKSSLFAVIAGRLEADQGNVTMPRGTLISEVMQETPRSADSAIDYVIDGDAPFRAIECEIERADAAHACRTPRKARAD
ncbi:MAG: hypothetical protein CM1200mP20_16380 [Pseudomonadota bacterium]|nr:MAG: hypothetical protein CM1200mP20_16380 [Pseudomonadota bacterium]